MVKNHAVDEKRLYSREKTNTRIDIEKSMVQGVYLLKINAGEECKVLRVLKENLLGGGLPKFSNKKGTTVPFLSLIAFYQFAYSLKNLILINLKFSSEKSVSSSFIASTASSILSDSELRKYS